jgi:predicted transcriptional regulator
MLSERDLQVATALDRSPKISDLMTEDPFVVQREADVKNVVKEMIDRRVDSAIVAARPGKPWGIFTQTDALRLLTKVL